MHVFSRNPVSRSFSAIIIFIICFSLILSPHASYAQMISPSLPTPGAMVMPTEPFVPLMIKGMTIHPDNPLRFDFIIDTGDSSVTGSELSHLDSNHSESVTKLIKYFLASLTVPKDELWVNLSPYEKGRMIPESLGKTALGRDLLAQDYLLKQLTASLMYPEEEMGKKFWDRIYKEAYEKYGTTDIPVDTFNKVWILPESAKVYENKETVYVVEAKLRVMLEKDYVAMQAHKEGKEVKNSTSIPSNIIRQIILPAIEKEVNEGANFAPLRQIYNSLILAKWYKETVKNSIISQAYVDKNMITGVDIHDPMMKQKIYEQYMQAYKNGVYNYIKDEYDPTTKEIIPRKYFSGGFKDDMAQISRVEANFNPQPIGDFAMITTDLQESKKNDEQFDVLDPITGFPTGEVAARGEVHDKGIWHRVVHVLLVNEDTNEVISQVRGLRSDIQSGGKYEISAGGHVPKGLDVSSAAKKEVFEELKLSPEEYKLFKVGDQFKKSGNPENKNDKGSLDVKNNIFNYYSDKRNNEFCTLFIAFTKVTADEINLRIDQAKKKGVKADNDEVMNVEAISIASLMEEVSKKDSHLKYVSTLRHYFSNAEIRDGIISFIFQKKIKASDDAMISQFYQKVFLAAAVLTLITVSHVRGNVIPHGYVSAPEMPFQGKERSIKQDDGEISNDYLMQEILYYALIKDESFLRFLKIQGVDFNTRGTLGDTALHRAVSFRDKEAIELLIKFGADVNAQTKTGITPIMLAAEIEAFDLVKFLVSKKADVNIPTEDKVTPLILAVQRQNYNIISFLLEHHADPNVKFNHGANPILIAYVQKDKRIFDLLIKFKADLDMEGMYTETVLHWACYDGDLPWVKYLVEHDASIDISDDKGATPLLIAAGFGQFEIVKYLVEKGANVNHSSLEGHTALSLAKAFHYTRIFNYLLRKGAKETNVSNNAGVEDFLKRKNEYAAMISLENLVGNILGRSRAQGTINTTRTTYNEPRIADKLDQAMVSEQAKVLLGFIDGWAKRGEYFDKNFLIQAVKKKKLFPKETDIENCIKELIENKELVWDEEDEILLFPNIKEDNVVQKQDHGEDFQEDILLRLNQRQKDQNFAELDQDRAMTVGEGYYSLTPNNRKRFFGVVEDFLKKYGKLSAHQVDQFLLDDLENDDYSRFLHLGEQIIADLMDGFVEKDNLLMKDDEGRYSLLSSLEESESVKKSYQVPRDELPSTEQRLYDYILSWKGFEAFTLVKIKMKLYEDRDSLATQDVFGLIDGLIKSGWIEEVAGGGSRLRLIEEVDQAGVQSEAEEDTTDSLSYKGDLTEDQWEMYRYIEMVDQYEPFIRNRILSSIEVENHSLNNKNPDDLISQLQKKGWIVLTKGIGLQLVEGAQPSMEALAEKAYRMIINSHYLDYLEDYLPKMLEELRDLNSEDPIYPLMLRNMKKIYNVLTDENDGRLIKMMDGSIALNIYDAESIQKAVTQNLEEKFGETADGVLRLIKLSEQKRFNKKSIIDFIENHLLDENDAKTIEIKENMYDILDLLFRRKSLVKNGDDYELNYAEKVEDSTTEEVEITDKDLESFYDFLVHVYGEEEKAFSPKGLIFTIKNEEKDQRYQSFKSLSFKAIEKRCALLINQGKLKYTSVKGDAYKLVKKPNAKIDLEGVNHEDVLAVVEGMMNELVMWLVGDPNIDKSTMFDSIRAVDYYKGESEGVEQKAIELLEQVFPSLNKTRVVGPNFSLNRIKKSQDIIQEVFSWTLHQDTRPPILDRTVNGIKVEEIMRFMIKSEKEQSAEIESAIEQLANNVPSADLEALDKAVEKQLKILRNFRGYKEQFDAQTLHALHDRYMHAVLKFPNRPLKEGQKFLDNIERIVEFFIEGERAGVYSTIALRVLAKRMREDDIVLKHPEIPGAGDYVTFVIPTIIRKYLFPGERLSLDQRKERILKMIYDHLARKTAQAAKGNIDLKKPVSHPEARAYLNQYLVPKLRKEAQEAIDNRDGGSYLKVRFRLKNKDGLSLTKRDEERYLRAISFLDDLDEEAEIMLENYEPLKHVRAIQGNDDSVVMVTIIGVIRGKDRGENEYIVSYEGLEGRVRADEGNPEAQNIHDMHKEVGKTYPAVVESVNEREVIPQIQFNIIEGMEVQLDHEIRQAAEEKRVVKVRVDEVVRIRQNTFGFRVTWTSPSGLKMKDIFMHPGCLLRSIHRDPNVNDYEGKEIEAVPYWDVHTKERYFGPDETIERWSFDMNLVKKLEASKIEKDLEKLALEKAIVKVKVRRVVSLKGGGYGMAVVWTNSEGLEYEAFIHPGLIPRDQEKELYSYYEIGDDIEVVPVWNEKKNVWTFSILGVERVKQKALQGKLLALQEKGISPKVKIVGVATFSQKGRRSHLRGKPSGLNVLFENVVFFVPGSAIALFFSDQSLEDVEALIGKEVTATIIDPNRDAPFELNPEELFGAPKDYSAYNPYFHPDPEPSLDDVFPKPAPSDLALKLQGALDAQKKAEKSVFDAEHGKGGELAQKGNQIVQTIKRDNPRPLKKEEDPILVTLMRDPVVEKFLSRESRTKGSSWQFRKSGREFYDKLDSLFKDRQPDYDDPEHRAWTNLAVYKDYIVTVVEDIGADYFVIINELTGMILLRVYPEEVVTRFSDWENPGEKFDEIVRAIENDNQGHLVSAVDSQKKDEPAGSSDFLDKKQDKREKNSYQNLLSMLKKFKHDFRDNNLTIWKHVCDLDGSPILIEHYSGMSSFQDTKPVIKIFNGRMTLMVDGDGKIVSFGKSDNPEQKLNEILNALQLKLEQHDSAMTTHRSLTFSIDASKIEDVGLDGNGEFWKTWFIDREEDLLKVKQLAESATQEKFDLDRMKENLPYWIVSANIDDAWMGFARGPGFTNVSALYLPSYKKLIFLQKGTKNVIPLKERRALRDLLNVKLQIFVDWEKDVSFFKIEDFIFSNRADGSLPTMTLNIIPIKESDSAMVGSSRSLTPEEIKIVQPLILNYISESLKDVESAYLKIDEIIPEKGHLTIPLVASLLEIQKKLIRKFFEIKQQEILRQHPELSEQIFSPAGFELWEKISEQNGKGLFNHNKNQQQLLDFKEFLVEFYNGLKSKYVSLERSVQMGSFFGSHISVIKGGKEDPAMVSDRESLFVNREPLLGDIFSSNMKTRTTINEQQSTADDPAMVGEDALKNLGDDAFIVADKVLTDIVLNLVRNPYNNMLGKVPSTVNIEDYYKGNDKTFFKKVSALLETALPVLKEFQVDNVYFTSDMSSSKTFIKKFFTWCLTQEKRPAVLSREVNGLFAEDIMRFMLNSDEIFKVRVKRIVALNGGSYGLVVEWTNPHGLKYKAFIHPGLIPRDKVQNVGLYYKKGYIIEVAPVWDKTKERWTFSLAKAQEIKNRPVIEKLYKKAKQRQTVKVKIVRIERFSQNYKLSYLRGKPSGLRVVYENVEFFVPGSTIEQDFSERSFEELQKFVNEEFEAKVVLDDKERILFNLDPYDLFYAKTQEEQVDDGARMGNLLNFQQPSGQPNRASQLLGETTREGSLNYYQEMDNLFNGRKPDSEGKGYLAWKHLDIYETYLVTVLKKVDAGYFEIINEVTNSILLRVYPNRVVTNIAKDPVEKFKDIMAELEAELRVENPKYKHRDPGIWFRKELLRPTPKEIDKKTAGKDTAMLGNEIVDIGKLVPDSEWGKEFGAGMEAAVFDAELKKVIINNEEVRLKEPVTIVKRNEYTPTQFAFFNNLTASLIDDYYLSIKKFSISHIPKPLGQHAKGHYYVYAHGNEGFPWRLRMAFGPDIIIKMREFDDFVSLFYMAGMDLLYDTADVDSGSGKNIVIDGFRGVNDELYDTMTLPKTWQRIDFGVGSTIVQPQKTLEFVNENTEALKESLGWEYDLLRLSAIRMNREFEGEEQKKFDALFARYQQSVFSQMAEGKFDHAMMGDKVDLMENPLTKDKLEELVQEFMDQYADSDFFKKHSFKIEVLNPHQESLMPVKVDQKNSRYILRFIANVNLKELGMSPFEFEADFMAEFTFLEKKMEEYFKQYYLLIKSESMGGQLEREDNTNTVVHCLLVEKKVLTPQEKDAIGQEKRLLERLDKLKASFSFAVKEDLSVRESLIREHIRLADFYDKQGRKKEGFEHLSVALSFAMKLAYNSIDSRLKDYKIYYFMSHELLRPEIQIDKEAIETFNEKDLIAAIRENPEDPMGYHKLGLYYMTRLDSKGNNTPSAIVLPGDAGWQARIDRSLEMDKENALRYFKKSIALSKKKLLKNKDILEDILSDNRMQKKRRIVDLFSSLPIAFYGPNLEYLIKRLGNKTEEQIISPQTIDEMRYAIYAPLNPDFEYDYYRMLALHLLEKDRSGISILRSPHIFRVEAFDLLLKNFYRVSMVKKIADARYLRDDEIKRIIKKVKYKFEKMVQPGIWKQVIGLLEAKNQKGIDVMYHIESSLLGETVKEVTKAKYVFVASKNDQAMTGADFVKHGAMGMGLGKADNAMATIDAVFLSIISMTALTALSCGIAVCFYMTKLYPRKVAKYKTEYPDVLMQLEDIIPEPLYQNNRTKIIDSFLLKVVSSMKKGFTSIINYQRLEGKIINNVYAGEKNITLPYGDNQPPGSHVTGFISPQGDYFPFEALESGYAIIPGSNIIYGIPQYDPEFFTEVPEKIYVTRGGKREDGSKLIEFNIINPGAPELSEESIDLLREKYGIDQAMVSERTVKNIIFKKFGELAKKRGWNENVNYRISKEAIKHAIWLKETRGDFDIVTAGEPDIIPIPRINSKEVSYVLTVYNIYPIQKISENKTDHAMTNEANPGGIDMNDIEINRASYDRQIQFEPKAIENIISPDFQGFEPVIINITPIQSILPILGLVDKSKTGQEVISKNQDLVAKEPENRV